MHRPPFPSAVLATGGEAFSMRVAGFRQRFDAHLAGWLEERLATLGGETPEARELGETVAGLARAGGKRLRPALVEATWRACGGDGAPESEGVGQLALGVEILHTYLLIHDDIMDHAALRRGRPTAHEAFAAAHRRDGLRGGDRDFGTSAAILAGDLAHSWAQELLGRAVGAVSDPARRRALGDLVAAMTAEVVAGQYLEILVSRRGQASEEELARVLRMKSGRYSVERPVELGALYAGAGEGLRVHLARCGRALGEAFQLQDDVLGTFGDPGEVGKPVASDLEEGKMTFLVLHTLTAAPPAEAARLRTALGRPGLAGEEVMELRRAIRESGALARVEGMIGERLETARAALAAAAEAAPDAAGAAEGFAFLAGLVDDLAERRW
jgi:geranylgeranyl diphosphate synthase type I